MNASEHKRLFGQRVKEARERRGYTQEQISELLGIKQTKYHKYEGRSYMPHALIRRFCMACGVDIDFLYEEKAISVERPPEKPKPRKRVAKKHPQAA